jgi:hypothetical protein
MMQETFDLIRYQREARSAGSARDLFFLWDQVCGFYERGKITRHELEEIKDVIWPSMASIKSLRSLVDEAVFQV